MSSASSSSVKQVGTTEKQLRRIVIPASAGQPVTMQTCTEAGFLAFAQDCVGGIIEAYPFRSAKYDVYVNEEGVLLNLPANERLAKLGIHVSGTAVLGRTNQKTGEEKDLPADATAEKWEEYVRVLCGSKKPTKQ